MTDPKTHRTRSGRTHCDEEIEELATEIEKAEYDVEALKKRRRGRPPMGLARLMLCLYELIRSRGPQWKRGPKRNTPRPSELVREAVRWYLDSPEVC